MERKSNLNGYTLAGNPLLESVYFPHELRSTIMITDCGETRRFPIRVSCLGPLLTKFVEPIRSQEVKSDLP